MPKEKRSQSVVLNQFVKDYDCFTTDGQILFCKYCEVSVTATKKFQVTQHIQTTKHIHNKNRKYGVEKQVLLSALPKSGPKKSTFNEELCEALISADIPLAKLSSEKFRDFLEKYTKQSIPSESTLRKNYVPDLYNVILDKVRDKARNKKIWVSLDETADVEQRCVVNFVFGILGEEEERTKSYVVTLKTLQNVNSSSIAAFFNDTLNLLWPSGILYENVLVVCTDAAPYMCKAMKGLQVLYPKMIHVTCVAHGLHRVAEVVRVSYPEVNTLISSVKKIFLKAPSRVEKFRVIAGDIPLPPSPVITRWGTWLDAATYYAENFEVVEKVVSELNPEDAQSIEEAQEVLRSKNIRGDLAFIKSNLACISSTILKLEAKGTPLKSSVELVEKLYNSLGCLKKKDFSQKLRKVMDKNVGYQQLRKVNSVLENGETVDESIQHFRVSELADFKFAPLVSCDVERIFSEYKSILSSNRRSFLFENLMHHIIIKSNFDL